MQTKATAVTSTPLPDADLEMEAALLDAHNTLDQFIGEIGTPHPARTIVAVKSRFYPTDGPLQEIWVDNVTYEDDIFYGMLGDDIPSLRLSLGDWITVRPDEVLDWMIVQDGKLIGGYTIRLAYQRMSPEEKQNFLESLDYSLDE